MPGNAPPTHGDMGRSHTAKPQARARPGREGAYALVDERAVRRVVAEKSWEGSGCHSALYLPIGQGGALHLEEVRGPRVPPGPVHPANQSKCGRIEQGFTRPDHKPMCNVGLDNAADDETWLGLSGSRRT